MEPDFGLANLPYVFTQSNVISDSVVSGDNSDILYRFSVDNLPLRYPFNIEPKRRMVFFLRSMTDPETCATLSTNQQTKTKSQLV